MQEFNYVLQDPDGIHARPAGMLVKKANSFRSRISMSKGTKVVDAKRIFSLMSLGAQKGDSVFIRIEGDDEDQAAEAIQTFLKENL
jgi:phosphocarrier protein